MDGVYNACGLWTSALGWRSQWSIRVASDPLISGIDPNRFCVMSAGTATDSLHWITFFSFLLDVKY